MALVLSGKGKATKPAAVAQPAQADKPAPAAQAAMKAATPTQAAKPAVQASTSGKSFLKKGDKAKETFEQEEAKAAANKDRTYRFFLKNGGETSITFLDGDVDADGALQIPFYYEHFVKMSGKVHQFVCTQDDEPCPICEGGDTPSFVGIMSIIDHTPYTNKDGQKFENQVRLFVAKRGTIKQLQKLAAKRNGLRGCRFDVSRTGDKEAAVGNVFDFTEKLTDQALVKLYGDNAQPVDYEKALGYLPAKDLRKLGFGALNAPVGTEAHLSDENYDKEL